jgi:flagellar hook-length control protein FliK
MKAISPSLPMTTPSRQANGADTSAADDAFGALIAAVIGAPAPRSTPAQTVSSSHSSAPRVDKVDDARPAAATRRPGGKPDAKPDAKSDDSAPANTSDVTGTARPATAQAKVDEDPAPAPAASKAPSHAAKTPPSTTSPDAAKIPAGLEKAAAALAQALATSTDGPAKSPAGKAAHPGVSKSAPALALAQPGSALTEGQLPAQLVAAVTNAHAGKDATAAVAAPASGVNTTAKAPHADQPMAQAAPVVVAQPPADAANPPPGNAAPVAQSPATQAPASSDTVSTVATPALASATPADAKHKGADANSSAQQPAVGDSTTPQPGGPFAVQTAPPTTPSPAQVTPPQPPQPAYTSGMVSQQIVQVVAPLRTAKDGDYTLSLQLHPAELGPVTVRVDVQQGVLSVHLSADHTHGHDALNQSLADLRTQLQSNGVRTGDIVVAAKPSLMPQQQDAQQQNLQHHTGGRHQQEAPMYDDTGDDRGASDHAPRHAPTHADDDTLDVRI